MVHKVSLLIGLLLGLFASLGAPSSARAVPITVSFPGVFTEVNDPDLLDPAIAVGASFIVSYTIDPDAVEERGCSTSFVELCVYDLLLGSFAASFVVGGRVFSTGEGSEAFVGIQDDFSFGDAWGMSFSLDDGSELLVSVGFNDPSGVRVTALPFFVNEALDGWDSATLSISQIFIQPNGGGPCCVTRVGSLAVGTIVPEPSTLALLAFSLAALVIARRRMI